MTPPLLTQGLPVLAVWRERPGLPRAHTASVLLTGGTGLALLLGGEIRASVPAFSTIHETGGITFWGILMLVTAVAMALSILTNPRAVQVTLAAAALLFGLFALWFLIAALHTTAAFLGPLNYLMFCWLMINQIMQYER